MDWTSYRQEECGKVTRSHFCVATIALKTRAVIVAKIKNCESAGLIVMTFKYIEVVIDENPKILPSKELCGHIIVPLKPSSEQVIKGRFTSSSSFLMFANPSKSVNHPRIRCITLNFVAIQKTTTNVDNEGVFVGPSNFKHYWRHKLEEPKGYTERFKKQNVQCRCA